MAGNRILTAREEQQTLRALAVKTMLAINQTGAAGAAIPARCIRPLFGETPRHPSKMMFRIAALLLTLAIGTLADAPSTVTRTEAMATAEVYRNFKWTPTPANIFHGKAPDGIRVDTPDAAFKPKGTFPGWWEAGMINKSMPYKWGGFDTPETFLAGLSEGKAAGDICTPDKRRLLDDAVSKQAVGIDCSGFVSRCWNLPRSYSTRTITTLCDPVADMKDLKPGDILNAHNSHVFLFARWTTKDRSRMLVYTTGSASFWGVQLGPLRTAQMKPLGYTAWRYRGMRD
jgi:cell wall-associated NlpC family hydrolase